MQQSLSKFFKGHQRMIIVILLVYVFAMVGEFYALYETTKRHQHGQLLSQVVDNYGTHYLILSHEYSDIFTLKDHESIAQFNDQVKSLSAIRSQLDDLVKDSAFNDSKKFKASINDLKNLVDDSLKYFQSNIEVNHDNIRSHLSSIESNYSRPIHDVTQSVLSSINDLSDNEDYTLANFILLVSLQSLMTLLIIFLFHRSVNSNIIKPIENLSNTIRDIQQRNYVSTNYQPSSYAITELSQLQQDLSAIAMEHSEMKSKEQGIAMLEERLAMVPVAAHNIINPISSIKSISEHIEFTYFVQPEMKEHLHDVNTICDGLVRWLRNLLFLFKPANLSQKRSSIRQTIMTATEFSEHLIKKKNIDLTVDEIPDDAFAYIDQDLVEQSLSCIINNAAEAVRRKEGKIHIQFTDTPEAFVITVIDNGIGLSKNFFDGNTETTKKEGHGIGVAFARNVAMLHKPSISIAFANNQTAGANVTYSIPKQA